MPGASVPCSPEEPPLVRSLDPGRTAARSDRGKRSAENGSTYPGAFCLYLPMKELPLADVRNRLSELVAEVEQTHERISITKHGHPAAVLLSPGDLASIEET